MTIAAALAVSAILAGVLSRNRAVDLGLGQFLPALDDAPEAHQSVR